MITGVFFYAVCLILALQSVVRGGGRVVSRATGSVTTTNQWGKQMSKSKEQIVLNVEDVDTVLDGLALLMSRVCSELSESIDVGESKMARGMFGNSHFGLVDKIIDLAERLEGMKEHPLRLHYHPAKEHEPIVLS